MQQQNKYVERIPQEDWPQLRRVIEDLNLSCDDTEDWATRVGQYYVNVYGRPSEYDIYEEGEGGKGTSDLKALV